MTKQLPFALLVATLILLTGVQAVAGGVIRIVSWTGEVTIDDTALEEGKTVPAITEGATVSTGDEGNIFAVFSDGSQLRIKEDTVLVVNVIDPRMDAAADEDEPTPKRFMELRAGTIEYIADPSAPYDTRVWTIRGDVFTRRADVSVRVDAYEGGDEFACVIVHNVDNTTAVEGRPDSIMTILKEDVEQTGKQSGVMSPGSVLVLCTKLKRTLNERARRAIETAADVVPIIRVSEASPFREVLIFDF